MSVQLWCVFSPCTEQSFFTCDCANPLYFPPYTRQNFVIHRLSPDNHKWHQSTPSLGTLLPAYSKCIGYITHTWARKCILLSNCKAHTTNYWLLETDKQMNDCTQLPNAGCWASNKSLDWLLHFTQFKIMIPIFHAARKSQQHLAGQMVNIWQDMGLTWTDIECGTTFDTESHSSCKNMNPHLIKF